jgi:hypothetical protein
MPKPNQALQPTVPGRQSPCLRTVCAVPPPWLSLGALTMRCSEGLQAVMPAAPAAAHAAATPALRRR